jgi:hypothetical protein
MSWQLSRGWGYNEEKLMKMNTNLSAFTSEVTEAKGVMSVEMTIAIKTFGNGGCRREV